MLAASSSCALRIEFKPILWRWGTIAMTRLKPC